MRSGWAAQHLLASGLLSVALCIAGLAQAAPTPAGPASAAGTKAAAPKAAPPAPVVPDDKGAKDLSSKDDTKAESAGLPIPRFVSLRTDPINLRTGPGIRYPVDWVYRRRHLPVEVVQEFDTWRKIRDPDGTEGWVHQSMLTGKRTAMVKGQMRTLRRTGADEGDKIATLEPGVIVTVQRCPSGPFCRIEVNGLQGWLKRDEMWGVYPDETIE